jgi:hypothetical protein
MSKIAGLAITSFLLVSGLVGSAVAGVISDAAAKAPLQKLTAGDGSLKEKYGYWVECDNVGENCHYVYAFANILPGGDPTPGAKPHRILAKHKVEQQMGYWVECDNVGENCHYVYAFANTNGPKN